jgi:hypothetical protein
MQTGCLVHGCLYSRHVIVEPSDAESDEDARLAGIIDWGDVHAGDPSGDLACAWSLFESQVVDDCWSVTEKPPTSPWFSRGFVRLPILLSASFMAEKPCFLTSSGPAGMRCSGCSKTDGSSGFDSSRASDMCLTLSQS